DAAGRHAASAFQMLQRREGSFVLFSLSLQKSAVSLTCDQLRIDALEFGAGVGVRFGEKMFVQYRVFADGELLAPFLQMFAKDAVSMSATVEFVQTGLKIGQPCGALG